MSKAEIDPGLSVRALLRRARSACLTSLLARDDSGWPYGSLVLLTVDHDATPVLLLSDLSDHSQNIAQDRRVSLLLDGTAGWRDPLAGPRATVLGEAEEIRDASDRVRLKDRFIRRHPGAVVYADFKDFRLYRVVLSGAHLVAGFGRIHWLEPVAVLYPDSAAASAMASEEAALVDNLNQTHGGRWPDLLDSTAERGTVSLAGLDPEGCDFLAGDDLQRRDFTHSVARPAEVEAALLQRLAR